jgi:O-antigen biosynthesis protein
MVSKQRVCIITPDIIGPIKNGGIGTHCFYLAKFLAQDLDQDVTVLFTSIFETESIDYWRKYYKTEFGIQFIYEAELPPMFAGNPDPRWFIERSQRIYKWLKDQEFQTCYFQEWQANGFISIQAKRTQQAFHNTDLICMMHSSSEWIREGMRLFPTQQADDLVLDYAERYCIEFADYSISPSRAMFDWAETHGWEVSKRSAILPYLFEPSHAPISVKFKGSHLIFFGRLETRKGLEIFLKALQQISPRLQAEGKLLKISFLGKNGTTSYGDANGTIHHFLSAYSEIYQFEIFNSLSQSDALKFLTDHAEALVVTPSLADNLPFAVLECIELNINLIAAKTGGIPEMFADEARLFSPTVRALASKLTECIFQGLGPLQKAYSSENSRMLWKEFCQRIEQERDRNEQKVSFQKPLVSICIPHYNCGKFLLEALQSLEKQTYEKYEVIVVDDGSTQAESLAVFEALRSRYADRGWLFLTKSNGGPGSARNLAVSKAQGKYLIFLDSDNAAEPYMIERMVSSMEASGIDCLSCYYRVFDEHLSSCSNVYQFACSMIGPCIEASVFYNVLGDTNFIIKADVFSDLNGFVERVDVNHEDRELLAKLSLAGYSLDVIPDFLFRYRLRKEGFNRTTNSNSNEMVGMGPLLDKLPWWGRRFMLNAVGSLRNSETRLASELLVHRLKLEELAHQLGQVSHELAQAKRELHQAKSRVTAMETSKFWRMRKSWFKLKKAVGMQGD